MRRETVVIGDKTLVFGIPDFVHDFDPHDHTYKGSLHRHITVERVLLYARRILLDFDAVPFYNVAEAFMDLLFGLNCNFPLRDIAPYMLWTLRGGTYPCLNSLERKNNVV